MSSRFLRAIYLLLTLGLLLGITCFGALFFLTHVAWVDLTILEHYNPGNPSIVLDDEGHEWARFQIDRRQPIALHNMPDHVIKAFLAAEDHRFFYHNGISYRGIIRSILVNFTRGKKVQGASTITQQLVRLLFFDQKKTFSRKIKEQILSIAIERQYTKELILETYLNNIYFGCGIYGVEAASQQFWKKSASELTIGEAATLAAILRNPGFYCPLINPQNTTKRRGIVLQSMHSLGYISAQQMKEFNSRPVTIIADTSISCAPHAREFIRQFLESLVGKKQLYTGGYIIQTTLNKKIQYAAEASFKKNMPSLRKKHGTDTDGALVSMDVATGNIKAVVGGTDFSRSQFNRAFHARRQLGSVLKPVLYAAAIDHGMNFTDTMIDEPLTLIDHGTSWSPQNFNDSFEGSMTLAQALTISNNIIAIKILLALGIQPLVRYARALHLEKNIPAYPSLALGCADDSAIAVAGMFNVFANKGIYVEPHLLMWVKDTWGKKIWKYTAHEEQVLSWDTTSKVAQVLSNSFNRFRKKRPRAWLHQTEVICKTGTTNQSRTCWFAGSTPTLTTVVYVGRDSNESLGNRVFPTTTAFPIWLDLYETISHPISTFLYDPSLIKKRIDPYTGKFLIENGLDTNDALSILVHKP